MPASASGWFCNIFLAVLACCKENTRPLRYASQSVDQVQRQEQRLRAQQNKALNALLKRIQRDRSEQLRQRGVDSRRLCQRNKNLRMDLEKKQHFEFLRAEAAIKAILGNAEQAEKLLEAQDSSFLEKLGIVNGGLKDPSVS